MKKQIYEYYNDTTSVIDNEMKISQLKQQLSKKEQELKQLKLDLGMFKSVNEFINNYGIEKARECLLQTELTKKQNEILFHLKKLKKIREDISYKVYLNEENESFVDFNILQYLDYQIKKLKKELKNEKSGKK